MNERIRELAEQAGAYHINDPEHPNDEPLLRLKHIGIEKFAELIVRECASICELNGQSYKHSFTPMKARLAESTSVYCGELIKRHFGVENV